MGGIWWIVWNVGCACWCVALAFVRHDWTWYLVAALAGASAVLAVYNLGAPRSAKGLLRWCPGWMSLRAGQWVSTRVPFVRRLWVRRMDAALVTDADLEQALSLGVLLFELNRWAYNADSEDAPSTARVMAAWCAWRSDAERAHRYRERKAGKRLDLPVMLAGMPRMEEVVFDNAKH